MNYNRREFIEALAIGSGSCLVAMTGVNVANAVELPGSDGRFSASSVDGVLSEIGATGAKQSSDIKIKLRILPAMDPWFRLP